MNIPAPLCEHEEPLEFSGKYKVVCPVCKSFWDLEALNSRIIYNQNYPEARSHFDPVTGKNKVKTLQNWLRKTNIDLHQLNVCEIGFGGGYCLHFLQRFSKQVFGVEAISENIEHAVGLGVRRESVFLADSLPPVLPCRIDLWIFQDSFEHLPDPSGFMKWITRNSSDLTEVLLVAPDGGSLSEKVLGKLWPHRLTDHCFHWSKKGLTEFFSKRGFLAELSFSPSKYVSVRTIISHILIKLFPNRPANWKGLKLPDIVFKFNIGETGFLYRRILNDGP